MSERKLRLTQVQDGANTTLDQAFPNNVNLIVSCSDLVTSLTANANVAYVRAPKAFTITTVSAALANASGTGNVVIAIQKNGSQLLSTNMNVDTLSVTSVGGNTPGVVGLTSVAYNDLIQYQIANAGVGATGLTVTITGYSYSTP